MKHIISILSLAALISCGAAGEPLRPNANLGLSIGSDGVQPRASVGASNGPVNISVAL